MNTRSELARVRSIIELHVDGVPGIRRIRCKRLIPGYVVVRRHFAVSAHADVDTPRIARIPENELQITHGLMRLPHGDEYIAVRDGARKLSDDRCMRRDGDSDCLRPAVHDARLH